MGIDSINGSGQNAQLWQLMLSAMDSALTGASDSDPTSTDRPEGIGQFLGRMEQLRSTDSNQLLAVLSQISGQLQGASQQSDGAVGDILSLMAGGFQSSASSNDLSTFLSNSPTSQNSLDSFFGVDGRDPFLAALTAGEKSMGTAAVFQQLLAWQEAKGSANDIIDRILRAQGV
jgi:hypothetical protein